MSKESKTRTTAGWLTRGFTLLLAALMLLCAVPTEVFAIWDGQGNGGNSGASDISGGYNMPHADEQDILGYRFTVYDSNAKEALGESVDIDRYESVRSITSNTTDAKLYRAYGTSKKSHIDLYRDYLDDPNSVDAGVSNSVSNAYHYVDTSLPATPTDVEYWLTDDKAKTIADYAGASASSAFNVETCYIIVEPIIVAKLQNQYFACTLAEFACFQASSSGANYGWTGLGASDANTPDTYRYALMRPLSAYFGRYLYAVKEYSVFETLPVTSDHLKNDDKGMASVLVSGNVRYNTAENVLKYQMGMAIYTHNKAKGEYTLTVDPNGGVWSGSSNKQSFILKEGDRKTIATPTRENYSFAGWSISGGGTLSGRTYTQGTSDCTMTALWTPNAFVQEVYVRYQQTDGSWSSYTKVISASYSYGANFPGWSRAADVQYKAASLASYTVTAAKASYVDVYRQQYTVKLSKGTGIASVSGAGTYYYGASATISATVSAGYTWSKWTGSHNTTTQKYTFTVTGNVTDTANATAVGYTITYNANGGTLSGSSTQSYNVTTNVTLQAAPTRTGYTFAGWKVTTAAGNWTSGQIFSANQTVGTGKYGNITLTAQWTTGEYVNTIAHWAYGFKHSEGNNGAKNAFKLGTTTFNKAYGGSVHYTASDATTIPNGFYLNSTFGTSSYEGTWKSYDIGAYFTQPALATYVEYYYQPYSYTITYNLNGGTNSSANPSSYTVLYGVSFATPTRAGYDFAGWYINGTKVTGINVGANATFTSAEDLYAKLKTRTTGNVTVEARWTPHTYKVIYTDGFNLLRGLENVGGTTSSRMTYSISNGTVTVTATGSDGYGFTTGRVYLEAGKTYYFSCKTDGTWPSQTEAFLMLDGSTSVAYYHMGSKDGYTFTPSTTGTYWLRLDVNVSGETHKFWDISIVAGTVGYGTSGFTASSSHTYDVAKNLTANGYTRIGYTFSGWNTKADGSGTKYSDKQSVKNLTATNGATVMLYAQWTPITYTVKYDGNGATGGSTASSSHTYDVAKNLTANSYTKTGYTFSGWNTKADGTGTKYSDKQSVKNLTATNGATVTLYAQWTPITYTVKYDGNGATGGSTASSSHTYDVAKNLTANGYTKTGYTFSGWNTKADGTGTKYSNKQSVKNLTATNSATITLYAQWTPIAYKVVYHDNLNLIYGLTDVSKTTSGSMAYSVSDGTVTVTANSDDGCGFTNGRVYLEAGKTYYFSCVTDSTWGSAAGSDTVEAFLMLDGKYNYYIHMSKNGYAFTPTQTGTYYLRLDVNQSGKTHTFRQLRIVAGDAALVTGHTASSSHTYDVAKNLTANAFARSGYTFVGWNTKADGTGTSYSDKQSVKNLTATNGATVTLYAQWSTTVYTNRIDHWAWGFANGEGNNGAKNAFKLGTTTFNKAYGGSVHYTASDAMTIPNGFYLADKFGTSSYSGTWTNYTLGTYFTQPAKSTNVEYDYRPYSYTITYNLNGGTNSSANPSSYTVLYGVSFATPTRAGYDFAGWYINGTKVTGINVGANATFSSAEDLYAKLKTRTTGNVTVEARWTPHTYKVIYTDGFNLLRGLENVGSTTSSRMTYSISNGTVTVTANGSDGYGFTTGRVYLEVGKTYYFSCKTDGTWPSQTEAFLMLDGSTSVAYYHMGSKDGYTFTPSTTGTYWLRLDVNVSGETHKFWDISIVAGTVGYGTSGFTASSSHTYDVAKNLTANGFSRAGYDFKCWNTKADGTGTSYSNKQSVKNLTATNGDTIVLYAQWTPATGTKYTVRHYLQDLSGSSYTLNNTEVLSGTTGATLTLKDLADTFTGFTYKEGKVGSAVVTTTTILADGSRVIDLYYGRNSYYLDLNGYLDGVSSGNISGYGTADVYINGSLVSSGATDYWKAHPYGTTYEIKNIKPTAGHSYDGVYSGSIKGTIGGKTTVVLEFNTITYTITYNANGGTLSGSSTQSYNVTTNVTLQAAPTRTGYTFAGWKLASAVNNWSAGTYSASQNVGTGKYGNITLTAQWTPKKITLTFDKQGGTGGTDQVTATYDAALPTITLPTRTGYTFLGYFADNDTRNLSSAFSMIGTSTGRLNLLQSGNDWGKTTASDVGRRVKVVATATVKASSVQFNDVTLTEGTDYTVTAVTGGYKYTFDFIITETMVSKRGSTPYDTSYRFIDLEGAASNSVTVSSATVSGKRYYDISGNGTVISDFTADATLYAHWQANGYTVTYDPKGGTVSPTSASFAYNTQISGMPTPSRTGYIFKRWYANFTGAEYLNLGRDYMYTDKISIHMEVYMDSWSDYTSGMRLISCTEGGGWNIESADGYAQFAVYDSGVGYKSMKTSVLWSSLSSGWHTFDLVFDGTYAYAYIDGKQVGKSTAFASGKLGYHASNVILVGAEAGGNATPAGSYFKGKIANLVISHSATRITSVSGNGQFTAPAQDFTLCAEWTPITYTVKYDGNGATGGSTASSSHTYDVAKSLTANGYTRTGYTFTGWNTKADGTGTSYSDKQSVKNLTATNGATVTLYAQWKIKTYTNSIAHWAYGFKNSEGNNGTAKNAFLLGTTYFDKVYGGSVHYTEADATTIPNGFYLRSTFGTSAYEGSWKTYAIGTYFTQPAKSTSVEYYYQPYSYTITYTLNGGTNSSANPSSYTVLYGVTFANPTRAGYEFAGWYINGTKVTGINVGANATFSSAEDLYAKLKTRTTGNVTVEARWTPITYTVKYDGNGATGGSTASSSHTYDVAKKLTANGYTKTGYTFSGWNTKADGNGTKYSDKQSVKNLTATNGATITLYAQWTPITYTVKYDGNGATGGSTASGSHTYDVAKNLTANGYTKTGYTFSGWNTKADGTGTSYSDKQSVKNLTATNGATVTLYAQWTPITYTVKYDGNGATGGSTASSSHTYDVAKNLTANGYTQTGYTFTGWNTKADGSGTKYSDKQSVKNLTATNGATITLYAQWTPITYKVIYHDNLNMIYGLADVGETASGNMTYTVTDGTVRVTAKKDDGYGFINAWVHLEAGKTYYFSCKTDGTWSGSNGTDSVEAFLMLDGKYDYFLRMSSAGCVFTPSKTGDYRIRLDSNKSGCTHTFSELRVIEANKPLMTGHTASSTHTYDVVKSLTANEFVRVGYTFSGWNTKADGTGTSYSDKQSVKNLTAVSGATVTLYAQWTPNTYKITLDKDGGAGGSDESFEKFEIKFSEEEDGAPIDKITPPTKPGYSFDGYYTGENGDGDQIIDKDGKIVVDPDHFTKDETIYAKWTPITYTVKYDGNGATGGSTASSAHAYDVAKNLTANGYTKTGYTFSGWNTKADGSGTKYSDKQSVKNLTATNGATVTLYAQWTPITYTVKYDGNGATGGSTASSSHTYDVAKNLTANGYTKTGYTFSGWNTKADGSGTAYSDKQSVKNLTATNGATVTLYAQWDPIDVALTGITFKYLENGTVKTVTDINNIPYGLKLYVFYTYTNYSKVTVRVNGYNNAGTKITAGSTSGYYELAPSASVTVQGGSFTPGIGAGKLTGYVYLDGYAFGDVSGEGKGCGSNNTMTVNFKVKFDIELKKVYLTDTSGDPIDTAQIPKGMQIVVHHVYRNNSGAAVTVNGYHNGSAIAVDGSPVFTLAAGSERDIAVAVCTADTLGEQAIVGAVYRNGKTAETELYETNLSNNTASVTFTVVKPPELEIIEPNAPYRKGTEVITSYYLKNESTIVYDQSKPLTVTMQVYDRAGNLLLTLSQQTVVPANETQLVYFRWTVPNKAGSLTIRATLNTAYYGITFHSVSDRYATADATVLSSPDTEYEASRPSEWSLPTAPTVKSNSTSWYVWEIRNGVFEKISYGIRVTPGRAQLTPDSKTAYQKWNTWYMKSGYGAFLKADDPTISVLSGCEASSVGMCTGCQWSYALWPEFLYAETIRFGRYNGRNGLTTLEKTSSGWELYPFLSYSRKHFTPIWYPDGAYYAQLVQSDIWTPMGMLYVSRAAQAIQIEGNMYDDWYIS